MKKILSKILISVIMIGIFYMPITGNIEIKNETLSVKVETSLAQAQTEDPNEAAWWYHARDGSGVYAYGPFTQAECLAEFAEAEGTLIGGHCFYQQEAPSNAKKLDDYGCAVSPTTWHKCIVKWVYFVTFMPLAFLARLAAQILDFFIYYSISSTSYDSDFVSKGWGIVRDIANIFFIVALLYVAIKTILDISVTNSKKMVGWIIVIALLINFSLFATKVVIDVSNILAKIFYNNITPIGANGQELPAGEEREKSITVGLVKQFNPHKIFEQGNNGTISANIGTFAALLVIGILLMGYMIYMFLSVAALFVARVISLWIVMIFSPLAFVSKTVSFDMGGLGFSKWSSNLFKNAFLAPIFIFFLYIIISFGEVITYGAGNATTTEQDTFQVFMGVLIPFIVVFGLLMQAKKIAVEYSGEMGANLTKAVSTVGGFALGAAAGGAGLAARATLGAGASMLARNQTLKEAANKKGLGGYAARMTLKTADYGSKASFDARNTKAAGAFSKVSGMDLNKSKMVGLGPKTGGYKGAQEAKEKEKLANIKKDAELYKTKLSDDEVKARSAKQQYEYNEKINKAIKIEETKKGGNPLSEAEETAIKNKIAEKEGPRPTVYNTAKELNTATMKTYIENIGKTGLLYSAAHTIIKDPTNTEVEEAQSDYTKNKAAAILKAETEQGVKFKDSENNLTEQGKLFETIYEKNNGKSPDRESVRETRVKNAQIPIGIGATIVTAGFAGPAMATIVGGGLAAGSYTSQSTIDKAKKEVSSSIKKTRADELKETEEELKAEISLRDKREEALKAAATPDKPYEAPEARKVSIDFDIKDAEKKLEKLRSRMIEINEESDRLRAGMTSGGVIDIAGSARLRELTAEKDKLSRTISPLPTNIAQLIDSKKKLTEDMKLEERLKETKEKLDIVEGTKATTEALKAAKEDKKDTK